MDRERFDALARLLATPGSRRAAPGARLGTGLAGVSAEALAAEGWDWSRSDGGGWNRFDAGA